MKYAGNRAGNKTKTNPLFDMEVAMPTLKRAKTRYPGVYFIMGTAIATGKSKRIYYIRYRKDGKEIEEKAGRQFQDDLTPGRAAGIRAERIQRNQLSNKEKREVLRAQEAMESGKWTIKRLWEEYKAIRPGLKGIVTDENRFYKHIKPVFGGKEPKEIIPLDIDRLRLGHLKNKKPGKVKNVLELLRRIINFGVKKNLCQGIDFTIEMPKVNNLKTEDLTPEQLSALLEAIEKDTNVQAANLMKMALFTGMRRGELFRLKWHDIDFDRGFIHIRDPKGGPDQKIPLNDAARDLLNSHPRSGSPQKLLTHKSPIMTQRYAHLKDETLKRASDLAGSVINNFAEGKEQNQATQLGHHKELVA